MTDFVAVEGKELNRAMKIASTAVAIRLKRAYFMKTFPCEIIWKANRLFMMRFHTVNGDLTGV